MTAWKALDKRIREISVKVEQHEQRLDHLEEGGDAPVVSCSLASCHHSRPLKEILLETVEVLESSRKAFKSKELEGLRKKLIRVLAENA